jgi:hypothetical protein
MHLTLRELLGVVTVVAIDLAGIVTGPPIAWFALGLCFLLIIAVTIIVFVAADRLRAFAVGVLVPVVLYAVIVLNASEHELDMRSGVLPTSQLFQSLVRPAYPATGGIRGRQVRWGTALSPWSWDTLVVSSPFSFTCEVECPR